MAAYGPPGAPAGGCCNSPCVGQLCVTVTGCNGNPVPWASVAVTSTGGYSSTQPVVTGVGTITRTAAGTGYTSAPTVTITGGGGTGATATATMNGSGGVLSVTVTNPGSGYTFNPTVSFSGGGGTGAAATAACSSKVCFIFATTDVGPYTITVTASRYQTKTGSTSVPCATGVNSTFALVVDSTNYTCVCTVRWAPMAKILFITDSNGTHTATNFGASWTVPSYSAPATVGALNLDNTPNCSTPATSTTDVGYIFQCFSNQFRLAETWWTLACCRGTPPVAIVLNSPPGASVNSAPYQGEQQNSSVFPPATDASSWTFNISSTYTSSTGCGDIAPPVTGTVVVSE